MPGIHVLLQSTSDDNLKVNKTLTNIGGYYADLLEECTVDNPKIIVTNTDSAALLSVNYAYIEDFHRYYFAKCTILDGTRFQFDLSVDRLMSFVNPNKSSISAYIERNETDYQKDILDDQAIFTNDRDITTRLITDSGHIVTMDKWHIIGCFNAGLCNTTSYTP